MIAAVLIGRAGSKGLPGKNTLKLNGKLLCEYPILAAKKCKSIDKIYVSTDCPKIKKVAKKYKLNLINRPKKLASSKSLADHVFVHAYEFIKKQSKKKIKYLVLLMANAPTINTKMLDYGINKLNRNPKFDSAVSVSIYNMWSPLRARRLNNKGLLDPFVPFKYFAKDPSKLNCDRDSQGDVYFADMSVSIVRPKCLENIDTGLLPQKWMGEKIAPIYNTAGCDIDFDWQIPMVDFWIKKNF